MSLVHCVKLNARNLNVIVKSSVKSLNVDGIASSLEVVDIHSVS